MEERDVAPAFSESSGSCPFSMAPSITEACLDMVKRLEAYVALFCIEKREEFRLPMIRRVSTVTTSVGASRVIFLLSLARTDRSSTVVQGVDNRHHHQHHRRRRCCCCKLSVSPKSRAQSNERVRSDLANGSWRPRPDHLKPGTLSKSL